MRHPLALCVTPRKGTWLSCDFKEAPSILFMGDASRSTLLNKLISRPPRRPSLPPSPSLPLRIFVRIPRVDTRRCCGAYFVAAAAPSSVRPRRGSKERKKGRTFRARSLKPFVERLLPQRHLKVASLDLMCSAGHDFMVLANYPTGQLQGCSGLHCSSCNSAPPPPTTQ